MKTLAKIYVKALLALWVFYLIDSITPNIIQAQEFNHIENIKLPSINNLGYPVADIITADGKLFLYSAEGILYFNPSDYPIVYGFVDLPGHFGKFNPVINGSGGHDVNLMALNEADHLLYVVTPSLEIMKISTTNPGSSGPIVKETPGSISHFKTLHGFNVIKYDPIHDRLYWLVEGRSEGNDTGNFHYRDTYLAVYKVNTSGDILTDINSMLAVGTPQSGQYMESIYDVEFNETNNYFYVAKKKHLEVWQIDEMTNSFTLINTINTLAGKFGKMLYLRNEDSQIHKILAFPYRLPFAGNNYEYEPPMDAVVRYFAIDGDDPFQVDSVLAPSKRINDAVFLPGYNDLILCYAPDEFVQNTVVPQNSDIAYYHFEDDVFTYDYTWNLNTNGFPLYNGQEQLLNRPNQLFANTTTSILTGKTHEIVRIFKNDGDYTFNQLLAAESNCFSKIAKISAKDYIIGPTLNGLAVYNESSSDITFIRTAYPVYNICANPVNGKLYFSNRLSSENGGFYCYDPATGVATHVDQYSSIGDIVFNEFTGHYLVSENAPDEMDNQVHVKVFDGADNALIDSIDIPGQYAKEMFISPQGWLYIMFDMHEGLNPKILVLGAIDYSGNTVIELELPEGYSDPFVSYTSEFLYNRINRSVYVTVSPNPILTVPYNPVINTMRDYSEVGIHGANGLFVELLADQLIRDFSLHFPGKMICPDAQSPEVSANYPGKIFIKTNSLAIYQYDYPNEAPVTVSGNPKYNEIIYSAYYDTVYGLRDEADEQTGFITDREVNIYKILAGGTAEHKFQYPGQAAAFFDNPYDTKLYVFVKIDDIKLGDAPAVLLQLDPNLPGFLNDYADVENTAFYIEYDHNEDYRFYFYNRVNPYIDRYSNQIYLPNGGHGNVSVVSFEAEEHLPLEPSTWNWLSIPRLDRQGNDPVPSVPLLKTIQPFPPESKRILLNIPPNEELPINKTYDHPNWTGDLETVQSTLGYKLWTGNTEANALLMAGSVLEPATTMTVYPERENWLGYFLPFPQHPFEAIPGEMLANLKFIKARHWSCVNAAFIAPPTKSAASVPGEWRCECNQGRIGLDYHDMVILTKGNPGQQVFAWNQAGGGAALVEKPAPELFAFQPAADYDALFLELDTTDLPDEIGAFAGDSCIGATQVAPGDTSALICAYTEGLAGEPITFAYAWRTKKSHVSVPEYRVMNTRTGIREKRQITAGEKQPYFLVSFRQQADDIPSAASNTWIQCAPNPADEILKVSFFIDAPQTAWLRITDALGRLQAVHRVDVPAPGTYSRMIELNNWPNGCYGVSLSTTNAFLVEKLLILH